MATVQFKHDYYEDDYQPVLGFTLGSTLDWPVFDMVSVEPGLYFTAKGNKSASDGSFADIKISERLYYLEIPVIARMKFQIGNIGAYGALGPYLGFGLSGKSKITQTMNSQTRVDEYEINWGIESGNDYKRGDFGFRAEAGIELNQLRIGLALSNGLKNISTEIDNGRVVRNRYLGVVLGYTIKA